MVEYLIMLVESEFSISDRFTDSIFMQGRFDVGDKGEVHVTAQRVPTSTIIVIDQSPDGSSDSCEMHIVRGEDSAFRM